MYFDDDLLSGAHAQETHADIGAGAPAADFEDGIPFGDAGSGAAPSSVETLHSSRRKRGSRGGLASRPNPADQKRWRSGAVPPPPTFSGDIEADPYCFRHYKRRLLRWVEITKEYLPGNEQALRALEHLKGEAEIEMEEMEDTRYNTDGGISLLLQDLERSFGAKEMFRQGGTIREFENVGRLQGESVHAFVRRFRLLERKLKDNQVPEYPEQARVIKLLDGLRLDEKSVASLLLAAGNRYDMRAILNAISIQYPAGLTITGMPRLRSDRRGRGRGTSSSTASSSASSTRSGLPSRKWRHWNTNWEDYADEEMADAEESVLPPVDEDPPPEPQGDDPGEGQVYDEDYDYGEPDGEGDEGPDWSHHEEETYPEDEDWGSLVQALTVTSKRLAGLVQARGYYQTEGKGKKGKGKSKGRGKGRGKPGGKASGKSFPSFGKASGKKGSGFKGKAKTTDPAVHQQRLQGSLCLGCGASDHWLKDCPSYNVQNAQIASASFEGLVLDADGVAASWMVSANEPLQEGTTEEKSFQHFFQAPPLSEFEPSVPVGPSILLQYYQGSSSAYIIADTGCQRQVAGAGWHAQKCREIQPLQRLEYPDMCKFSFGPSEALASQGRFVYPVAIAGTPLAMSVSSVNAKAPALMSRKAFEALGAVPDVLCGTMYFRALQCTTQLWLSPCGHLAVRLDEWGDDPFVWPPEYIPPALPDVIYSGSFESSNSLKTIELPARPVPHASANMAFALAQHAEEPPELRLLRQADGDHVLGHDLAPRSQGQSTADALSAKLSGDPPVNHGGHGSPGVTAKPTQWHGSESDRMSTGTGIYHEDMDWTTPPEPEPDWSQWQEPNWVLDPHDRDQLEGSEGEEFDPNDLIPEDQTDDEDNHAFDKDFGAFIVKKEGLAKRVRGNERALADAWNLEKRAYEYRAHRAREVRRYRSDIVEIYGGHAEITYEALAQGLRVLQPVDQIHGISLCTPADFSTLRSLLLKHKPFVTVFEFPCTLWSNAQYLNYDQATLDQMRASQTSWIKGMVDTIFALHADFGGHFILENPAYTAFWQHPEILRLHQLPRAELRVGHMCCYDLRGKDGHRLKKPTGWLSDLPILLDYVSRQCPGPEHHVHGKVLGGNSAKSQVYTPKLARAMIYGLCECLKESWLPLLKEAEAQLKDKVRPDRVIPLNTPFGEQLKALVPWKILRVQICRTPMQRRLPLEVLQAGAQHRGAALWLSDGSVVIEAEAVSRILAQSSGRFTSPIRVAVFFFGVAPASSLNETENERPEAQVKTTDTGEIEETEVMRLHTNLGHPSTATMVRPAKPFTARRFNDRLNLDVLWLRDISGRAHGYLSQVDEATSYHVLNYMRDRSEEETMRLLINGWFAFFGPPDELLLDSDGSFRGFRFETLQAQCAIKVRYAPADAHYQMGKVERHGQSVRYIVQRLVSQFSPMGPEELNVIVMMAVAAKNNLMRRAGSSPAQWVYGRNHRVPGSLLSTGGSIESCSIHDDSSRLRLVEQIRTRAMMLFHQFESDAALRHALLRKPRPARGPFVEGQRVAYYRAKNSADGEGTLEGYRQGVVVAIDGSTLWIRNTRGRLVSASKEQVRSVGGEEEWWAPSQADLDLLKKSDQDLADKYSNLAFRANAPAAVGADQAVAAELDFQLRAPSPAPRALLDQAGQPVLDADGQLVPATPAPPMMPPSRFNRFQNNRHYRFQNNRHYHLQNNRCRQSPLVTDGRPKALQLYSVTWRVRSVLLMYCPNRELKVCPGEWRRLLFKMSQYSYGEFAYACITKASQHHRHLAAYVLDYMRHHGMRGQATSIYISKNAPAKCHRDSHNLRGSLNWVSSVGSFSGGDRYSVVVYTSRMLPETSTSVQRRLRKMGFVLSARTADVWQVDEDELFPWLGETMAEAYPARAWQPPGEGETMAMDTSGDDAHDGAQEPPSRAQRQALKKELPWQAMSESEVPQFVQAVLDEWSEWKKWSSCRPVYVDVDKIDPSLILKVPLFSGDCKSAFLQGAPDEERPQAIYMKAPCDPVSKQAVEEWSEASLLYKLSAPVYGQANAPRRWYIHVARTLTSLGWVAHTLDPCLWLYREEVDGVMKVTGVLGVHVDDMIMSVLHGREAALEALKNSFEWGSAWESKEFTFVGRHIKQHEDWSLTVDQASYVAEVPITKINMSAEEKLSDHPELITEFRSGIGSLQWMAGTTRGDIAADTSLLQKPPSELTVADLLEVNSVLRYVRATSDAYYKLIPIDFADMLLIAYGDSAWANAPGGKSQGGLVVVATSKQVLQTPQKASLLEWKSYRHQRVLRSTLAAEAASLDKAEDYGNFLATMLSEMVDGRYTATLREVPIIEVLPVTDARSLWDAIHRLSTTFAEKRVEISIATLRQQCRLLRWVPTEQQLADVLTKRSRSLRDAFRKWMSDPWVTLVESRAPTDIDPNGANAAWR
ncbi:GIP [Symbiodinium sp. CCMP2456]|nr:GIP [Symbiodinium sp. CCMP2456]